MEVLFLLLCRLVVAGGSVWGGVGKEGEAAAPGLWVLGEFLACVAHGMGLTPRAFST